MIKMIRIFWFSHLNFRDEELLSGFSKVFFFTFLLICSSQTSPSLLRLSFLTTMSGGIVSILPFEIIIPALHTIEGKHIVFTICIELRSYETTAYLGHSFVRGKENVGVRIN